MADEGKTPKSRATSTRDIIDDLREWSGKVLQRVKEEADTLSTMGKLKLELSSLKSKRGSEFRKLGMKVYHLIDKGSQTIPETGSNVDRIRELNEEIRQKERLLKEAGSEYAEASEEEEEAGGESR